MLRTANNRNVACTLLHQQHETCTNTHQIIKDVALVYVNGDEGLKLDPGKLAQVLGGLLYQQVQHVQEPLVGGRHDLFVISCILQCLLCIPGPDHLDTQQAHLWQHSMSAMVLQIDQSGPWL